LYDELFFFLHLREHLEDVICRLELIKRELEYSGHHEAPAVIAKLSEATRALADALSLCKEKLN
jgi:hypothetical protein